MSLQIDCPKLNDTKRPTTLGFLLCTFNSLAAMDAEEQAVIDIAIVNNEVAAKRRRLFKRVKEEKQAGRRAWVSYDTLYVEGLKRGCKITLFTLEERV
ncbi:hypothetical protein DPMN_145736 [Dreissena polymorpha]|uniref:Uncharacterized protein n=1 Tax=Dreissena polymorpha TaxID=45954 RepID=A0A9D4IZ48_DREPO|nr:hypothetical protein DPMN_145736 [Dreissena polymorpha]